MVMRHYTDETGRQGIERLGLIAPSADGRLYVTPDSYESGRLARERLSLTRVPAGYFAVPDERLPGLSEPSLVEPKHGLAGGGVEAFVTYPVDAGDLVWTAVGP